MFENFKIFTSLYNKPWVVVPSFFDDLEDKLSWLVAGSYDKLYLEAMEKAPKTVLSVNSEKEAFLAPEPGKTVVVPITGILEETISFFGWLFGGTSTKILQVTLEQLIADETVETIILEINSPGGEIGGIANLAETIYNGREKKQILSVIQTVGSSGAYWLASAADKVYISAPTTQAGSIGVVIAHRDFSEAEKKEGIKTTEITAGRFKRVVSSYRPLDDEGLQELRVQANKFYQPFVEAVSKFRAIPLNEMAKSAEGRIFIGKEIIDVGLADEFLSLSAILENTNVAIEKELSMSLEKDKIAVTLDEVKENHFTVYQEIFELGASAERERIQGIEAISLEGFDSIIDPVKFDGKTTGPEVAAQIVIEQKKNRGLNLSTLANDSTKISHSTPIEPSEEKEVEEMVKGVLAGSK